MITKLHCVPSHPSPQLSYYIFCHRFALTNSISRECLVLHAFRWFDGCIDVIFSNFPPAYMVVITFKCRPGGNDGCQLGWGYRITLAFHHFASQDLGGRASVVGSLSRPNFFQRSNVLGNYNISAFSLNAIVDVRLSRRHQEMIFLISRKLLELATSKFTTT